MKRRLFLKRASLSAVGVGIGLPILAESLPTLMDVMEAVRVQLGQAKLQPQVVIMFNPQKQSWVEMMFKDGKVETEFLDV